MSEEQTKYYINITKEKLEGVDSISVELSDDEDIEISSNPNTELEEGKKITIISNDDYSTLEENLETISANTTNWLNNQARETIDSIFQNDYIIPYASSSGQLKNNNTNETIPFDNIKSAVDNFISKDSATNVDGIMINAIANIVYPVGSIYISVNEMSPQQLFGGEWEKIEGRFLLGSNNSYSLGATGGEANHTLNINEMPSHTHTQNSHNHTQNSHNHTQNSHNHTQNAHYHSMTGAKTVLINSGSTLRVGEGSKGSKNTASTTATNKATTATNKATTATNVAATATNQNTGGSQPHNNMPPYLVVSIWKRTR